MAKLSAHGTEIGRITLTAKVKAYMSDGAVLTNYGDGWKLTGKIKSGITPEQAYQNAVRRSAEFLAANPKIEAYRHALHAICRGAKRSKLHMAITMMPTDPDGVWSECCDGYCDNVEADIDEIAQLCALYLAIPQAQTTEAA